MIFSYCPQHVLSIFLTDVILFELILFLFQLASKKLRRVCKGNTCKLKSDIFFGVTGTSL